MSTVLSQDEIDLLLGAIDSGELNATEVNEEKLEVKAYDFRRPNKFTNDHMRTLRMIHENFARIVSNFLSGYLRTNVTINIASVDQITYEEFLVSIPSPTLLTNFNLSPLNGNAIFECNSNFTFPIIDSLFGGQGKKFGESRELTDIELSVLKKLNQKILDNLTTAWGDVFQFTSQIDSMETNPQLNQIISPNEIVALITFVTEIRGEHGIINLCFPFLTLEDVIANLSAQFWFSSQDSKKNAESKSKDEIAHRILNAPLDLTALCGETNISIRDFLQLSIGDVIPLDNKVHGDMHILVEGILKYKGQPGLLGDKLAIQVTEKVQEEM
ncbi:flagellar motor switch protein FliM [Desulfonispora thiosulfatigenes DSM 11270]|uniref:Flagellar motor switch protein FliM n=1 Tax=Desulfonispora thiosulfatigenes DSM 11270 TaxID=656914 RepID=A0A1W1UMB1_DESTI|nr:flagellar motor switch protein FliM [Desulfonispora thiosulfatigenes]SMB82236.1 flagellar motor switch protein FliM [Desulfonispora thiosulfatigenes DSM 11270]